MLVLWMVVRGASLLCAACGGSEAPAAAGDGQLVIELGGDHGSLRTSLQRLGVELLPPPDPRPEPAMPPARGTAPEQSPPAAHVRSAAAAGEQEGPQTKPPARVPQWREVRLQPRETLMDLAKVHLGSGLRFKEILALNGWTERDARRLQVGQRVKIPVDPR